MFHAAVAVEPLFLKRGVELVITSTKEFVKGRLRHSLHYKGLALDFRIWRIKDVQKLAEEMRKVLGHGYDVVVKKNHIHCEYDGASA